MPKLNKLCSYICIINGKMEVKAKSVTDKGTCYLKMISCEWKNHNFNYFFPLSNVVSKYINNDRKESESVIHSVMSSSFVTPWTVACQAPLSIEFSKQDFWSGLCILLQGIFPIEESNPGLLNCRQILYI